MLSRWILAFLAVFCLSGTSTVQIFSQSKSASNSSQVPGGQDEHIHHIEADTLTLRVADNEPALALDLAKLMQLYRVPTVSITVIDNFKIAWAKAYGVVEPGSMTAVTTRTLFQAGSISKPVAAAGALYLVQQGKLSLDENVNDKLKTWKVPENEFTETEKVTLRRLMSHTAGLTVHGFPGYDVTDTVPTVVQIFNGDKPANTAPIRVDIVPGTKQRYSGGGVTIEQQLMVDVTGKPFPALMRELVLDKIGMTDSSYEQPLPSSRAAFTAGGATMDGKLIHGRWHIYPEMAAAGLWTTPTDLAKFAIEIALSKQGKSNRVLSEKTTSEMLTPVMDSAALGFFVEKDNPGQFGHNGADEGFQALLTMNADTGNGVAIMADSDNGIAVGDLLLRRVAKEYAWNYKFGGPPQTLLLIAKLRGTQAALNRYTELRKTKASKDEVGEGALNWLGYTLLFSGQEQDAITVFQRNTQDYPESSNVWDSLAEAYMKTGQKDLAIQNYEKALRLDPKNRNATDQLKKLRASN
jgi:CubicO group peptidase (beta-lactamase class C family)